MPRLLVLVVLGAISSAFANAAVSSPAAKIKVQKERPLPPGWRAAVDPTSQRTYYWHEETKETTWRRPVPAAAAAAPPAMVPPPSPAPDLVSVDVDRAIKETRQSLRRQMRSAPQLPELRMPKLRTPELRMPDLRSKYLRNVINAPNDSVRQMVRTLKEGAARDPEKASPVLLGIYLGGVFLMAATFL